MVADIINWGFGILCVIMLCSVIGQTLRKTGKTIASFYTERDWKQS